MLTTYHIWVGWVCLILTVTTLAGSFARTITKMTSFNIKSSDLSSSFHGQALLLHKFHILSSILAKYGLNVQGELMSNMSNIWLMLGGTSTPFELQQWQKSLSQYFWWSTFAARFHSSFG